uniref:Ig-like domain-containing protein n=1 Tax=Maylandia zebra TaxID=106582 RepID=A0A3P9DLN6_9CICH
MRWFSQLELKFHTTFLSEIIKLSHAYIYTEHQKSANVPLTCRVPNNNGETVEWSRADLRDKCVLVLKNKKPKEDDQDPSFENRVALQDKEMDGNVSLILYNVTAADNGTYECRVLMEETQSLDLICNITLRVVDPPGERVDINVSGISYLLPFYGFVCLFIVIYYSFISFFAPFIYSIFIIFNLFLVAL